MTGTVVNALVIVLGGLAGAAFGRRLKPERTETIVHGLAIVVLVIGITPAVQTAGILGVLICLVAGTVLGELLNIERRLDRLGDFLRARFARGDGRGTFTEGFVTASLLMAVGSMAVMGALDAGIRGDCSVLYSKSVIDGLMAVTFAATLGVGVCFAALPVFVWQGALTLLASRIAPLLSDAVVTEMSAVGGILLIGTGLNMLGLMPKRIQVGNMLPAILLPIVYIPLAGRLAALL